MIELAKKALFRDALTFTGRSRRKEFWAVGICSGLVGMILGAIEGLTAMENPGTGPLVSIGTLLMLIPMTSVQWRRLHDHGTTGKWVIPVVALSVLDRLLGLFIEPGTVEGGFAALLVVLTLIGLVGQLALFIVCGFLAGKLGPNQYGEDPKLGDYLAQQQVAQQYAGQYGPQYGQVAPGHPQQAPQPYDPNAYWQRFSVDRQQQAPAPAPYYAQQGDYAGQSYSNGHEGQYGPGQQWPGQYGQAPGAQPPGAQYGGQPYQNQPYGQPQGEYPGHVPNQQQGNQGPRG